MMDIKYELEFFGYWHCGSGLSSGSDLDLLVIKDEAGIPFVPGKTIKGLLREAVEELYTLTKEVEDVTIVKAFGDSPKRYSTINADGVDATGCCFFKNAELKQELKEKIKEAQLNKFFYQSIASTKIDINGIAEENSLRRMEVTIPCVLHGEILNVPDDIKDLIIKGLKFIKRLGQSRNRGLGRCAFYVQNENKIEKGVLQ